MTEPRLHARSFHYGLVPWSPRDEISLMAKRGRAESRAWSLVPGHPGRAHIPSHSGAVTGNRIHLSPPSCL